VDQGFEYAKAAGMRVIIAAPSVEMLPRINQQVQKYDIRVAIHNHGPGDKIFPTPDAACEKIKDLDRRVGLCNDVGHTLRIGGDPYRATEQCADRTFDVHIKDVTAAAASATELEIGRGVIDIPRLMRTLDKIRFAGIVSFEYEKDPDDPLPGLAESVGYVRGVLAAI
jgi:inosose dehydratase